MADFDALYSLVSGEGDGAMLGLAAGDTAGGAWELGYSAHTEQATVVAYHLIERGDLDAQVLVDELRELDGYPDGERVYRSETPHFRAWLDRLAAGNAAPSHEPTLDPGPRAVPVGVIHRRDVASLCRVSLALGSLLHNDAVTILGGTAVAAAVAASCFGQSGRDLMAGVAETLEVAIGMVPTIRGVTGTESIGTVPAEVRALIGEIGVSEATRALEIVGGEAPWDLLLAGLLLAAPGVERGHVPVEQAARIGGSALGAVVGAIIGARAGIRAWPWAFANDTWFAEIGRRLARGPSQIDDLPIPYAVEQHLLSGGPGDAGRSGLMGPHRDTSEGHRDRDELFSTE